MKWKKKKGIISNTGFNIKEFFIYTKMQNTCLLQVLVIGCLQSHKACIVYQLSSNKLTLHRDFLYYFYLPTCYSGSFPILSSSTSFSLIHNFWFHLHSFFPVHISHSSIALSLPPMTKHLPFASLNSFHPLFADFRNCVFSLLHPFLQVPVSSHFTGNWEHMICSWPKQPKPTHASFPTAVPVASQHGLPSAMGTGFILLNSIRNYFNGLKTQHSPFGLVCLPGAFLSENSLNITMSWRKECPSILVGKNPIRQELSTN